MINTFSEKKAFQEKENLWLPETRIKVFEGETQAPSP